LYNRDVSRIKPIVWLGDSLVRLRAARADIRSDAGYQLDWVQRGESPSDFRPMPGVGSGVVEIRVGDENEFRVFYVARFDEAVYVLHCFVKKTRANTEGRRRVGEATVRLDARTEAPYDGGPEMKSGVITKSSGDVFRDLGFSAGEARNLRLRSELMTALRKFIESEGLTQAGAAKRLRVSQPRISDLTRGKISRFSLDTLVNMVTDAGMDVAVKIKRPAGRVA
jgi:phage-related protein/predicted XRE-type DNA-binding protein